MKLMPLLIPIIGFGVAMQVPELRNAMMPALNGALHYIQQTGDLITDLFVYVSNKFAGAVSRG